MQGSKSIVKFYILSRQKSDLYKNNNEFLFIFIFDLISHKKRQNQSIKENT